MKLKEILSLSKKRDKIYTFEKQLTSDKIQLISTIPENKNFILYISSSDFKYYYKTPLYPLYLFEKNGNVFWCAFCEKNSLEYKVEFIKQIQKFLLNLNYSKINIAMLCAVEKVNPAMKATLDAAILTRMSELNQFPKCVIEGPLAVDNAVSREAAKIKGLESKISGEVDVYFPPEIESSIILRDILIYYKYNYCAFFVGEKFPVLLKEGNIELGIEILRRI